MTVIGASDSDVWELRVIAPDGQKKWKHDLHGHDNAHNADAILNALKGITIGYPLKKYLRLGDPVAGVAIGPSVGEIRGSSQWVSNIKDATADYEQSAKVTQQELKDQLGIETTLEELPNALLMISRWVVCNQDRDSRQVGIEWIRHSTPRAHQIKSKHASPAKHRVFEDKSECFIEGDIEYLAREKVEA